MSENELKQFLGKNITVIADDNSVFSGYCSSFTSSLDNDNGIASIDIEIDNFIYELYLNEIKSINIKD